MSFVRVDDSPSWWGDGDILMAIDLGYDESGDGDILLVSVQAGVTEQAKRLKKKWKARLKKDGLECFHSKDFNNYTGGVFSKAKLDRRARHALLMDLSKQVHRHLLFAVTAGVSIAEYERYTSQKFRSRYGTAYGFLIDMCMLSAYACLEQFGYNPEFNILIESGHRNANQAAQILTKLMALPIEDAPVPIKVLTAGLGNKKDHGILQAADMVAYGDWQGMSKGDRSIWDALHRPDARYRTWRVRCDRQLIDLFSGSDGLHQFVENQKKEMREGIGNVAEQGISELLKDDGRNS